MCYPSCGVSVLCHIVLLHRQLVGHVDVPCGIGQVHPVSLKLHARLMPLHFLPESMGGWGVHHRAWLLLKDHKMFGPPQPKEAVEIDDDKEEESANGMGTNFDTDYSNKNSNNDLTTPKSLFGGNNNSFRSSNGSRGPEPGWNKSKAKNIDLEHKAKQEGQNHG